MSNAVSVETDRSTIRPEKRTHPPTTRLGVIINNVIDYRSPCCWANTGQRLRYGQVAQFWGEGLGEKLAASWAGPHPCR